MVITGASCFAFTCHRLGDAILFGPKRLFETYVYVGSGMCLHTLQPVHTAVNLRARRFRIGPPGAVLLMR